MMPLKLFVAILCLFACCRHGYGQDLSDQDWSLQDGVLTIKDDVLQTGTLTNNLIVRNSHHVYSASGAMPNDAMLIWDETGLGSLVYAHGVVLLNRKLDVAKRGSCYTGYNDVPILFVQFKIDADRFPLTYRQSWHYGAILFDGTKSFPKSGRVFLLINGQYGTKTDNGYEESEPSARLAPIIWDAEKREFGDKLPESIEYQDKVQIRKLDSE